MAPPFIGNEMWPQLLDRYAMSLTQIEMETIQDLLVLQNTTDSLCST